MIRYLHMLAVAAVWALSSGPGWTNPAQNPPDTQELAQHSTIIFAGEVEEVHASNLKILPARESMALVRVKDVFYAPKTMPELRGQQITLEFAKGEALKRGDLAVFYANGWLYGENLAVKEVGHTPEGAGGESVRKEIAEVRARVEEEKLRGRIAQAAMVVTGKVVTTRPLEAERKKGPVTEHDPNLWVAEIQVESFLKGSSSSPRVLVLYPNSDDVMWVRVPKYQPNQEGIWILQIDKTERFTHALGAPAYAALDPLDFHPKTDLDLIKRLVGPQ